METTQQAGADARRLALHDLHALGGAAFESTTGLLLPAFYGRETAVAAEYAAARETAAITDLSDRALLAVTGPIRQKFLHNILSADVQNRSAGQGCLAALMDVKGHLVSFLRVLVTADRVWLEMPSDRLAVVEAALLHYRVAAPVRFERAADVVLGLLGPQAEAVLQRAGLSTALPSAAEDHVEASLAGVAVRVIRASDLPADGLALHVSAADAPTVWEALLAGGAVPLGRRALDILRVEDGRPWYGPDVDEHNLLHETGVLDLYRSPAKGCYIGQEVLARLDGRGGHVNKALRGLRLGAPARAGDAIEREGREVGRITTAALSPRLGPIAMAYLHRSAAEPGMRVDVAGSPALVDRLPLSSAQPADLPGPLENR